MNGVNPQLEQGQRGYAIAFELQDLAPHRVLPLAEVRVVAEVLATDFMRNNRVLCG